MVAYLRSALFTTVAVGAAIAAAWPVAPAAVNASTSVSQVELVGESRDAVAYYFAPAADPASAPLLHTTSARLDRRYSLHAQTTRAIAGLDPAAPLSLTRLSGSAVFGSAIPLADALAQVERIADARHVDPALVRALVYQYTEYAPLGLGAPAVNAPLLNLALDALQ